MKLKLLKQISIFLIIGCTSSEQKPKNVNKATLVRDCSFNSIISKSSLPYNYSTLFSTGDLILTKYDIKKSGQVINDTLILTYRYAREEIVIKSYKPSKNNVLISIKINNDASLNILLNTEFYPAYLGINKHGNVFFSFDKSKCKNIVSFEITKKFVSIIEYDTIG